MLRLSATVNPAVFQEKKWSNHILKRINKTPKFKKKSVHQEKCKYKHLAFDLNLYMEEFIYWAKSSNSAGIQRAGLPRLSAGSGVRKDAGLASEQKTLMKAGDEEFQILP